MIYLVLAHFGNEAVGFFNNVFVQAFADETEAGLLALTMNEAVTNGRKPDVEGWRNIDPGDWHFTAEPAPVKPVPDMASMIAELRSLVTEWRTEDHRTQYSMEDSEIAQARDEGHDSAFQTCADALSGVIGGGE